MNISLTPSLEQFVRDRAESGAYNNASEVVRDALDGKGWESFNPVLEEAYGDELSKECSSILGSITRLANPSAHSNGAKYEFTRVHARFLLRSTTAFIALIGDISRTLKEE